MVAEALTLALGHTHSSLLVIPTQCFLYCSSCGWGGEFSVYRIYLLRGVILYSGLSYSWVNMVINCGTFLWWTFVCWWWENADSWSCLFSPATQCSCSGGLRGSVLCREISRQDWVPQVSWNTCLGFPVYRDYPWEIWGHMSVSRKNWHFPTYRLPPPPTWSPRHVSLSRKCPIPPQWDPSHANPWVPARRYGAEHKLGNEKYPKPLH